MKLLDLQLREVDPFVWPRPAGFTPITPCRKVQRGVVQYRDRYHENITSIMITLLFR